MELPKRVTICDVGPRDGLQAIRQSVSVADKVRLINSLISAGVPRVEAGSFVRPDAVPQMAETPAVLAGLARTRGVRIRTLALNRMGVERALAERADEVLFVVAASETFQRKNARRTVAEGMNDFREPALLARAQGVHVQAGIATAFGCPYEGAVAAERVLGLVGEWAGLGVSEVVLADTTGMADPAQVYRLCCTIQDRWPGLRLALHFHNTRGLGLANVLAGLQAGVVDYDASIGGLGGCPFAPKATGNICTEDLVHMLHAMGIETGIDLEALIEAARWLHEELELETPGLVMRAGPRTTIHPC